MHFEKSISRWLEDKYDRVIYDLKKDNEDSEDSEEELNLYFKAFVKENFKTKFEKNFQFEVPVEIVNYFEKNTKSKIKKFFLKEKTIIPKKNNKIYISKIKNASIIKI